MSNRNVVLLIHTLWSRMAFRNCHTSGRCGYVPQGGFMNTNPQSPSPFIRKHLNIEKDRAIRRCLDENINPRLSPVPPRTQDRKYLQNELYDNDNNPAGERQRRIDRHRSLDTNDITDPVYNKRFYK